MLVTTLFGSFVAAAAQPSLDANEAHVSFELDEAHESFDDDEPEDDFHVSFEADDDPLLLQLLLLSLERFELLFFMVPPILNSVSSLPLPPAPVNVPALVIDPKPLEPLP